MPIYEYTCQRCQTKFDQLLRTMSATDKQKCPKCGSTSTARSFSVFAVGAAESSKSSTLSDAPMCGRCGGPGPCAIE